MRYLLCATLIMLAACNSAEDIAARKTRQAQKDDAACVKAGYAQGTGAYDACRERIRVMRDQRKAEESYAEPPPMSNSIYRHSY